MIPTMTTWLFHQELRDGKINFREALRISADDLGATAIEIPRTTYPDWSMAGVRQLKSLLQEYGLFCAAVAAQNHFNCTTHAERRREVQLTKDFIDISQFLGARVVNIFHAGWGDRQQARSLKKEMLECLRDVTAYAEEKGMVLALEAHGPLTDNADEFLETMAACPSEYLRVNLDTGNMYEGPEANLKLIPLTGHVHVKPRYRDLDGQVHDAEVKRVLAAVKKSGYRGPVTLEHVDGDALKETPPTWAAFTKVMREL